MRGYDPRIHDENQQQKLLRWLSMRAVIDCRVKPGNDREMRSWNKQPAARVVEQA
jgi:hypothetical protein